MVPFIGCVAKFVPLELHEAFGREGYEAPREEDAIGRLGGEIDIL